MNKKDLEKLKRICDSIRTNDAKNFPQYVATPGTHPDIILSYLNRAKEALSYGSKKMAQKNADEAEQYIAKFEDLQDEFRTFMARYGEALAAAKHDLRFLRADIKAMKDSTDGREVKSASDLKKGDPIMAKHPQRGWISTKVEAITKDGRVSAVGVVPNLDPKDVRRIAKDAKSTTKEYEIHVNAKYNRSGDGRNESAYFKEYVNAATAAEAKRILKEKLVKEGYFSIRMEAIEVEKDDGDPLDKISKTANELWTKYTTKLKGSAPKYRLGATASGSVELTVGYTGPVVAKGNAAVEKFLRELVAGKRDSAKAKDAEAVIYQVTTSQDKMGRLQTEYFSSADEVLRKHKGRIDPSSGYPRLEGFRGPMNNGYKNGKKVFLYEDKNTYLSMDSKAKAELG